MSGKLISWGLFKKDFNPMIMKCVDQILGHVDIIHPTLKEFGFSLLEVEIYYASDVKDKPKESAQFLLDAWNIDYSLAVYYAWWSRDRGTRFILVGFKKDDKLEEILLKKKARSCTNCIHHREMEKYPWTQYCEIGFETERKWIKKGDLDNYDYICIDCAPKEPCLKQTKKESVIKTV